MDVNELANAMYEAYSDFFEDPQPISYWEIEQRYGTDSVREADMVADAIDLGCGDAQGDLDEVPRTREELIEEIASWYE